MSEPINIRTAIANRDRVKLKRVGDGRGGRTLSYDVYWDGSRIGNVARTGEYGRDDYPWGWHITDEVQPQPGKRATGSSDLRRDAIAELCNAATGEVVWY